MSLRRYTITVFTDNSPGVLHRLTTTFTRRKLNIESLTVCDTETHGVSRFTIVVICSEQLAQTVVKQINRIVEVREAYCNENRDLVHKEIAFYKVAAKDAKRRFKIEAEAERHNADVIYAEQDFVIVEKTGTEDETMSLFRLFEPYGILEFVRSGRIALRKEARSFAERTKPKAKQSEEQE